jgi:hypothetical protein
MEGSLCIHDEILLATRIEARDKAALVLKETMEEAEKVLLKIVPVWLRLLLPTVGRGNDTCC